MVFGSSASSPDPGSAVRVLVAVTDAGLVADIRRAAAAAGVVVVAPTADGSRSAHTAAEQASIAIADWREAQTVVLDAETGAAVLRDGLPRRDRVIVAAAGRAELAHWQLAGELGASGVLVLPRDEAQLVHRLGAAVVDGTARGGVIAVVGARGGAGASSFATALGHVAAGCVRSGPRDRDAGRALLIDADRHGGGLDLLLGWEERPGVRWPDLVVDHGVIGSDALFAALPGRDGLAVLSTVRSGDPVYPAASTMSAVIDAVRIGGDVAVIDCPRIGDDAADIAVRRADLVVLVCPATTTAIAAAAPVVERLRSVTPDFGVVVRGPSALGRRPDEIADLLEVPLLAAMRPEPGLATCIDRNGWPSRRRASDRSPLIRGARAVWDRFRDRSAR